MVNIFVTVSKAWEGVKRWSDDDIDRSPELVREAWEFVRMPTAASKKTVAPLLLDGLRR
jgi:hypothetical protein